VSWRDNLTTEQRARVQQMEAAAKARRIATWGTVDCENCADCERAGGAWWLGQAVYCGCANGQRVKALDAQRLIDLAAENAKAAAEAAAIAERKARACSRCGGSGRYGNWGECFRCNGAGVDPKASKEATK
jgi:hypothetical protein